MSKHYNRCIYIFNNLFFINKPELSMGTKGKRIQLQRIILSGIHLLKPSKLFFVVILSYFIFLIALNIFRNTFIPFSSPSNSLRTLPFSAHLNPLCTLRIFNVGQTPVSKHCGTISPFSMQLHYAFSEFCSLILKCSGFVYLFFMV